MLWDREPVLVRDILEVLNSGRRKKLAYNTVQTMLTVLKDKKVAKTRRGEGRAHVWLSRVTQDAVTVTMVGDLVERLFDGAVEPLVHRLVDSESLDERTLRELRRSIDRKLRDRKGAS